MAKRFWWNPTGSEPFMNFYGLLEKFFKFPILQILSKFDTFPFCIMSYFDHFRILLEFWNIPFVLGQVLHVIYIAHSKKVIRTLIFHFRFFPVSFMFYLPKLHLRMSKFWSFLIWNIFFLRFLGYGMAIIRILDRNWWCGRHAWVLPPASRLEYIMTRNLWCMKGSFWRLHNLRYTEWVF